METDCRKCGAISVDHIPTVVCGDNCHECGRYAYRVDQPSYLYLLTNEHLGLHKIGIGTVGKDKGFLQQLIQDGWTPYGLWHAADSRETFRWEKEVFKELNSISTAKPEPSLFHGRSDRHWVESINASAISVTELAQLALAAVTGKVK